jgi:hypothetical protein
VRRREFITLLGGAAVALPFTAWAQQGKGPLRLGFLPIGSPSNAYDRSLVEAFQQGLRKVGLIENRDIILDVVWMMGDPDQAVSEVLRRGAETDRSQRAKATGPSHSIRASLKLYASTTPAQPLEAWWPSPGPSRARGGSGRCAMSLSVPEQKPAQLLDCAPA